MVIHLSLVTINDNSYSGNLSEISVVRNIYNLNSESVIILLFPVNTTRDVKEVVR